MTATPDTVTRWQPIETAPKDGKPIVGLCNHEADPYWDESGDRLTIYGSHCEGLTHVDDGPHVLVWGGGDVETDEYGHVLASYPDWWFRAGSHFEEAANPTHWVPLPEPPQ